MSHNSKKPQNTENMAADKQSGLQPLNILNKHLQDSPEVHTSENGEKPLNIPVQNHDEYAATCRRTTGEPETQRDVVLNIPGQNQHTSAGPESTTEEVKREEDDGTENNKAVKYRSEVTHLLCGMYSLVVVVIGFVFPISSVLTHAGPVGEDYYVEIFHLYIYSLSLFFLLFLHISFIYDSSTKSSFFTWRPPSSPGLSKSPDTTGARARVSTSTSSISRQAEKGGHSVTYQCGEETGRAIPYDDSIKQMTSDDTVAQPLAVDEKEKETAFIYIGAEGVNFFLRLGAIGFATGSMIHDGFKLAQSFELNQMERRCYGVMYLVTAVAHLLFTFLQTFFIFKNHELIIKKHKAFYRLGLCHIIATNISVWGRTVVYEIAEDLKHKFEIMELPDFGDNFTLTTDSLLNHPNCEEGTDSLARRSARFLFPCTIEYSLIAAAVVYKIYCSVGTAPRKHYQHHYNTNSVSSCHKAHRGLFLGLFVGVLTLISIGMFYVFQDRQTDLAAHIFYTSEIVLLSLTSLSVCVGFHRINKLCFIGNSETADSSLLLFSVFGVLVFNCFCVVSSLHSVSTDTTIACLAIVTSFLGFMQAALQTVFILDGLGRCSSTCQHVTLKPGRTVITFLLMCNISLWLINTFEMERTDNFPIHTDYFGSLPWSIVSHFCLPLLIFFRFHSSICLSDIWIEAYEIKTKES